MEEWIGATGHEHVTATHESTLEVTTDDYLTPAGDCIIGIHADRAPADFDSRVVQACQDASAKITLQLTVEDMTERICGRGHPDLTFASGRSLVSRTSEYVDDRTVLVGADKAAADLDRDLVAALEAGAGLQVRFSVE
jgi:hypothetical protein